MIIRLIVLLAFIAVPCFAAETHYPTPTHDQIKAWWKPENREKPDEDLDVKNVHRVGLKSGENAFVASVTFPTRARCCDYGILLVRPALQEARQTHSIANVSKAVYLFDAHISGIALRSSFTGQGQTSGYNAFLYFDDWEPVTIFNRGFGDGLGACGMKDFGRSCSSEEVTWFFTDLDGDHTEDLVELIVYKDGDEPDQLTWRTEVNAYLIKDKKFIPVSPNLIPSKLLKSQRQAVPGPSKPTDVRSRKSEIAIPLEYEQPRNDEFFVSKCSSRLDEAMATARDILSQFGVSQHSADLARPQ